MSDTIFLTLSPGVWTEVSATVAEGLLTNEGPELVKYLYDSGTPSNTDIRGHTLYAKVAFEYKITAPDKLWIRCEKERNILAITPKSIGDNVVVTNVTPGTGATDLGKAEDAPHTSGDVGVMQLAVRNDAAGTLVDTDGDYSPLQVDANGNLKVTAVGTVGGTKSTDDSAFTVGSDSGTPAMGLADDTAPDSVDEGDVGVMRMSLNRNLYTQIRDGSGNERGANVNASNQLSISVDNTPTLGANSGVDIGDVTINNTGGASAVNIQDGGNSITIDDGGASLTVDGAVTVSQGTHDNLNVNANIQIGDTDVSNGNPVPISDAGGSITIDGSVSITGAVDTELNIKDLDTGAGTDNQAVVGIQLAESGGSVSVGSANPMPISDNGTTISVDDGGGSLTVDGSVVVTQSTHDNLNANANIQVGDTDVSNGNPVPISDAGGSITVDGTVSITGSVDTELNTADLDTGAGTDTQAVVGVLLAESGGGVPIGSANPMPISDNGGSVTVDGSVTIGAALPAGTNNIGDVDIVSLPNEGQQIMANSISVAIASDQSAVPVSDGGGSLTIDGSVSITGALPAGTNNIGDVDVLSIVPGTGATNLGKAEDAAHTSGDVGVMPLAVRNDGGGSLVGTDGDYAPLQVNAAGELVVTTAGGGGGGGTSEVDDSAFTIGTDSGTPAMGVATEGTPDSVDDGDVGVFRMSLNRNLYTQIRDGAGNERGANVNSNNSLQVAEEITALDGADAQLKDYPEGVTTKAMPIAGVNMHDQIELIAMTVAREIKVYNEEQAGQLNTLIKEMKKMNLQLAIMTDNLIEDSDIEVS